MSASFPAVSASPEWDLSAEAAQRAVRRCGPRRSELPSLEEHLLWELGRVIACLDDLPDDVVRVRPRATDANSLMGSANHALGAAEEHVLVLAAGAAAVFCCGSSPYRIRTGGLRLERAMS